MTAIKPIPNDGEIHIDAYGIAGDPRSCVECSGKRISFCETCLTCGGYGWICDENEQ